jgi:uncharacterized protein (DUF1800 family)
MAQPTTKAASQSSDAKKSDTTLREISPKDFGRAEARHLLWRAGLGGTQQQIDLLVSWGPEKSVDTLLDVGKSAKSEPFKPASLETFDHNIMRPPTEEERRTADAARRARDEDTLAMLREKRQEAERDDRRQMGEVQKWWLTRMIETSRPLEEKLTLLWHGHFATSFRVIEDSYHMFRQNEFFRQNAAGNFGDLLVGIVQDPAMLKYLDNDENRKGRPNENLAREIMELFGLGLGNYSEEDIKEGARALTGYTYEDDGFVFRQRNHDPNQKTILGQRGNWNGEDFARIILSKNACARFIARKLYAFFVADLPSDEQGGVRNVEPWRRKLVNELGDMLQARNYELKPVLRRLFLSEHFYSPDVMRSQIKSPTQLVVGAARSLGAPTRDLSILNDALDLMGQRLFLPPSVKGWPGGRAWINTSTLYVRQNTLVYMLTGNRARGSDRDVAEGGFDALGLITSGLPEDQRTNPDAVSRRCLRVTLGSEPDDGVAALKQLIASRKNKIDNTVALGCLLVATAMPEYQLC